MRQNARASCQLSCAQVHHQPHCTSKPSCDARQIDRGCCTLHPDKLGGLKRPNSAELQLFWPCCVHLLIPGRYSLSMSNGASSISACTCRSCCCRPLGEHVHCLPQLRLPICGRHCHEHRWGAHLAGVLSLSPGSQLEQPARMEQVHCIRTQPWHSPCPERDVAGICDMMQASVNLPESMTSSPQHQVCCMHALPRVLCTWQPTGSTVVKEGLGCECCRAGLCCIWEACATARYVPLGLPCRLWRALTARQDAEQGRRPCLPVYECTLHCTACMLAHIGMSLIWVVIIAVNQKFSMRSSKLVSMP